MTPTDHSYIISKSTKPQHHKKEVIISLWLGGLRYSDIVLATE